MSARTLTPLVGRRAGFQRGWGWGTISESFLFIPQGRPFATLSTLHKYTVHSWPLPSICLASQLYTLSQNSNHLQISTLIAIPCRIQVNIDLSLLYHLRKLPMMPTILKVKQIPSADFTLVHAFNKYLQSPFSVRGTICVRKTC